MSEGECRPQRACACGRQPFTCVSIPGTNSTSSSSSAGGADAPKTPWRLLALRKMFGDDCERERLEPESCPPCARGTVLCTTRGAMHCARIAWARARPGLREAE